MKDDNVKGKNKDVTKIMAKSKNKWKKQMVLKKSLFNKKNTEEEKDEIKDKMIE